VKRVLLQKCEFKPKLSFELHHVRTYRVSAAHVCRRQIRVVIACKHSW